MIRYASDADAAGICAIYNHYVGNTSVSFEEEAVVETAMRERMAGVSTAGFPWLVAEEDGALVGYAYANTWNRRRAYRFTVEVSIYLAPEHVGRGLGANLYDTLFAWLREHGYRVCIGVITLPNPASVAFHEKCGMRKAGHFEKVGYKFGQWLDVGYWTLQLNEPAQAAL